MLNYNPVRKTITRYKTKNKSFYKFNKIFKQEGVYLEKELNKVNSTNLLDEWMNKLYEKLDMVMKKCFRRESLSHKPTLKWFTNDLRIERNKVNAAFKRTRKYPDIPQYRDTYVLIRRKYKQNLKVCRRKSWLQFCERTSNAFGSVYKFVSGKALHNTDFFFTILENSHVFETYDDVLERLMEEHFGVSQLPVDL